MRQQNALRAEAELQERLNAKDDVDNVGAGRAAKGANHFAPARKTTNFYRNLSFFSYIRLAASYMRKRVIFASQVICASRVEDYKANIISL